MTGDITPQVVSWLRSSDDIVNLVGDSIGAVVYTEDDWPAIQVGAVTGSPRSDATSPVDIISDWNVALYILAGRRNAGRSDLPDHRTVNQVAGPLLELVRSGTPWTYGGVEIVRAEVVSTATGIDPNTLGARMTVTLSLTTLPS